MYYEVEMDEPSDDTVCGGCGCGWNDHFDKVAKIGSCSLTPGDASPAGRCPKCDELVYPQKADGSF